MKLLARRGARNEPLQIFRRPNMAPIGDGLQCDQRAPVNFAERRCNARLAKA